MKGNSMKKREITVVGDVAYVSLTKGYTAIIDAADAEAVGLWSWNVRIKPGGLVHARRTHRVDGKKTGIFMHRFLIGAPADMLADHINGNGLDNRRGNLRLATSSENRRNSRTPSNNTSGYKGVSWRAKDKKWRASIAVLGKQTQLGHHLTAELAHQAYCEAATKLHGDFANFGIFV